MSEKPTKQVLTYLSAMIAVLLWASAFPATRYALQHYSPVSLMVLRFVTASVTLIIIGIIKKINLPKLKDIPLFMLSGASGVFLYSFLFNTGSVTVSAGVSSFIIASSPIFTLILTRIFFKEKVKTLCWIGMFVGICGLAVVTLVHDTGFYWGSGLYLIVCAALCSGIYSAVVRGLTRKYTALEATSYTIIIGTIGTLIFLPTAIRELPDSNLTVNIVVLFMGIFPAAFAYLTWGYAISKAKKTAHVTVFSYLIPFVSTLIGYLWLHETMSVYTFLGGLVIIVGMLITNLFDRD
ncbi:MAG: DMT family transporter [Oscillospiraceae bacterium]|nr:DMT family transporter [Oscillospiraceae bacterium]